MPILPEFDMKPYSTNYRLLCTQLYNTVNPVVEKVVVGDVTPPRGLLRPSDYLLCLTIFFHNPGLRPNELDDNKPYSRFFISYDGTIEHSSGGLWTTPKGYVRLPKFRKCKGRSVADICEKLVKYANDTKASSPFN